MSKLTKEKQKQLALVITCTVLTLATLGYFLIKPGRIYFTTTHAWELREQRGRLIQILKNDRWAVLP